MQDKILIDKKTLEILLRGMQGYLTLEPYVGAGYKPDNLKGLHIECINSIEKTKKLLLADTSKTVRVPLDPNCHTLNAGAQYPISRRRYQAIITAASKEVEQ